MPFAKGRSGNPKGRPRGSLNTSKLFMRELAAAVVTDLEVQNRLIRQARDGTIHPGVLVALFQYHGGKPPVRVDVNNPRARERDELVARLRLLPKEDRVAYYGLLKKLEQQPELPPGPAGSATPGVSSLSESASSLATRA